MNMKQCPMHGLRKIKGKLGKYLQRWIEWWHKRWNYIIFRTFAQFESAPKMNHTAGAIWANRDRENMSLLDAAYAYSWDNIQLELACKAFEDGTGKGWTRPSLQKATKDQFRRGQRRRRTWSERIFLLIFVINTIYQDLEAPTNGKVCGNTRRTVTIGYKRKNERMKSSIDSFTALQRAYIIVKLRKNSYYKVEIGKSLSCGWVDLISRRILKNNHENI